MRIFLTGAAGLASDGSDAYRRSQRSALPLAVFAGHVRLRDIPHSARLHPGGALSGAAALDEFGVQPGIDSLSDVTAPRIFARVREHIDAANGPSFA